MAPFGCRKTWVEGSVTARCSQSSDRADTTARLYDVKRNTPSPADALGLCLALSALAMALSAPPHVEPRPFEPFVPNVNRAPPHELLLLPGVGPARAGAIVASRRIDGRFHTLEDLRRIRGIGPVTVAGLDGLATAGDP